MLISGLAFGLLIACEEPDRYGDVRRDADAPVGETSTSPYLADPPGVGDGESYGRSSAATGATEQGLDDLPAAGASADDRQAPAVADPEE